MRGKYALDIVSFYFVWQNKFGLKYAFKDEKFIIRLEIQLNQNIFYPKWRKPLNSDELHSQHLRADRLNVMTGGWAVSRYQDPNWVSPVNASKRLSHRLRCSQCRTSFDFARVHGCSDVHIWSPINGTGVHIIKLGLCAEQKWRRMCEFSHLAKFINGSQFKDGEPMDGLDQIAA